MLDPPIRPEGGAQDHGPFDSIATRFFRPFWSGFERDDGTTGKVSSPDPGCSTARIPTFSGAIANPLARTNAASRTCPYTASGPRPR